MKNPVKLIWPVILLKNSGTSLTGVLEIVAIELVI